MAKQQPEPQRFLFVFLEKSLSDLHKEDKENNFNKGDGGELAPVMTLDKPLDELTNFADIVAESLEQNKNWDIVIIGALGGKNGEMPSTDDADKHLENMMKDVESGGDLTRYIAFDKDGSPIMFE